MSKILSVSNITKLYCDTQKNKVGIRDVDFSVKVGEFVVIIGPSGCGKSTLLRCIAGFEKVDKGCIMLQGKNIIKPGPDRFMVFQGLDQLFPWLTVKENILFSLRAVKKANKSIERANYFLKITGLLGFEDYYPYQLSGGMKQRAAIARALSVGPKVLLMDEPFGSLDAFSRKNMQEQLLKIWETTGVTIIFVTHDLDKATYLSDKVLIFSPGKLEEELKNPLPRPRNIDTIEYKNFLAKIRSKLNIDTPSKDDEKGVIPGVKLAY